MLACIPAVAFAPNRRKSRQPLNSENLKIFESKIFCTASSGPFHVAGIADISMDGKCILGLGSAYGFNCNLLMLISLTACSSAERQQITQGKAKAI